MHLILSSWGDVTEYPKLIRLAFTGAAAYLIGKFYRLIINFLTINFTLYYFNFLQGGTTVHTGLRLKWGQEYLPLTPETMSTLRRQFERMMMVIIDEMSLVAADMFYTIHKRLVEILYLKEMFADRGVMLVGDLMQIPPVQQQQHSKFLTSYLFIDIYSYALDIFSSNIYGTRQPRK